MDDEPTQIQTGLGYKITQLMQEHDPFYQWFLVTVPVEGKAIDLVYGPYEHRDDAGTVGRRVVERLRMDRPDSS